jgi:DNA-binding NarL/FixJ family response regulator
MPGRTTILVAEDNKTVREAIIALLSSREEWEVCAQASDGQEAVEIAEKSCPDLAILDISMPRLNGIQAAKKMLQYCPKVVIVSQSLYSYSQLVEELKKMGVMGFVHKARLATELLPTIDSVLNGEPRYVLQT